MTLNEKIAYARKKSGLSQVDLADIMEVSRQSVSKWETGEANPEINKLSKLAEVLNVSVDWLLSEDNSVLSDESCNNTLGKEVSPMGSTDTEITEQATSCGCTLVGF